MAKSKRWLLCCGSRTPTHTHTQQNQSNSTAQKAPILPSRFFLPSLPDFWAGCSSFFTDGYLWACGGETVLYSTVTEEEEEMEEEEEEEEEKEEQPST